MLHVTWFVFCEARRESEMRQCNGVPIEEWANDLFYIACLNPIRVEAQGNQVLIGRIWQCKIDPKPDELALARMKSRESEAEVRTSEPFKTLGWAEVRSEKLIESGNSWFSPK